MDFKTLDRGPLDLEQRIADLELQKKYLQRQLRTVGAKLNALTLEFDKVVEENSNLKIMMKND
jgi:hypothetical protein